MAGTFSTPASMSDALTKSDFTAGASYRLSDLGKITPSVTATGGSYSLSDFAGKTRRFGDSFPFGYDAVNSFKGFDMTGTEQIVQGVDIANDNLQIPLMSLRAVVTFDANDYGVIFETGADIVGCTLYIDSSTLYWQAGNGQVAGGTMELSTDISGYSNGPREIVVTTDFRASTIAGTLSVDGTQVDSVNTTGSAGNVAGSDPGGSGAKYNKIAVLRNNQQSNFTGTIHNIRIYNF